MRHDDRPLWETGGDLPWETNGDLPWESEAKSWESLDESEPWRGVVHLPDWPEELAGPEYWLYKRLDEET